VHPDHTTRTESQERREISTLAITYLRNLLRVVGPLNANLRTAFQFVPKRWPRRQPGTAHGGDESVFDDDDEDEDDEDEQIRGKLAESSLWGRVQDFWSVVGWAFNCSVQHPGRWRWWEVWATYMLDVMEADWDERLTKDAGAASSSASFDGNGTCPRLLLDSILMMYINQPSGRSSGLRWIMKALFADGQQTSISLFQEVFPKETKGMNRPQRKRKRGQLVDLENDNFGDYFDESSDDVDEPESTMSAMSSSEPPTPQKPAQDSNGAEMSELQTECAEEAIHLRLRIIGLLSMASLHLYKEFVPLDTLYEEIGTRIKSLPLDTFELYVQQETPLSSEHHIFLIKELLHYFLPSSYYNPELVDKTADQMGFVTQPMMERCYLPYHAHTVTMEDNAKLSVLLEHMLLAMHEANLLTYTDSLRQAAEKGIEARLRKAKFRRGGGDARDHAAKSKLDSSGRSIEWIVNIIEGMEEMRGFPEGDWEMNRSEASV
jgi:hypothetical protein